MLAVFSNAQGKPAITPTDTIVLPLSTHGLNTKLKMDTIQKAVFSPDPNRAIWLAAIVPGLGQIYNRKYWKLPIIYGGFVGLAYAISWNNRMYKNYKQAYLDLVDNNPNTNSYLDVLPKGSIANPNQIDKAWLQQALQTEVNVFRRYRDLSIISAVGLYALSLIDAYVDAQMAHFDITPNLSLKVSPQVMQEQQLGTTTSYGLKLHISF
ncbi:MAG: DUF5683 domain-containing protein [Microbacter sp.]